MAQRVHTPTPKLLPVLGAPPRPGTPTPPMVRLGEAAIPRRWSGTGVSTRYCLPPWGKIERGRHQGCRRLSSWRRKEVALGRLSTLTVILIIGAWGAATEGAPPDDAISSPAKAARKPPPVPPIKYLEAGSRLFNSGNFELAAKYLNAAQMYRDQLQQDEQTMLDAYLKELSKVRASTAAGSTATDGAGPAKTAASPAMTPAAVQAAPPMTPAAVQAAPATTPAAVQAAPAVTPAAAQAAPAPNPPAVQAAPATTPAAVQAAPATTPAAVQAAPAMTPAAVQAAPAMTPAAVQAAPAMTPAAVQAASATTSVIQSGDPARGGAGD